ncbi:MAG: NAD kinase [Prevotella sp.]|jgi:NAD+ kinase|nr:NAD kinase [Prevotella sp.]
MRKLKFAIFGNEYQAEKSSAINTLLSVLASRDAEVYMERLFYDFLTRELKQDVAVEGVFDSYNFDADFVISMGGDGTFLKAANRVGAKGTPIIGINTGRLGFLADAMPSEISDAIAHIYNNEYETEARAVIKVEADGENIEGSPYALNDIAVLKRDNASMISIRVSINDEPLVTYQADGLIISTPTGSTAYNLSNGGPIIIPKAGILCLTPVAPHSLSIRPIVISDNSVIKLEVASRSHNFLVAIDGRSEKLVESTTLTVSRAPFSTNIIKCCNHRYFSTLREKLMWGATFTKD